mmetsp:Transcript_6595/g.6833  ORF Transcript_6595/g.6833 Transcript_6595/m.6833 type:complete len:125 (+) Transcript_6595:293-667(+)
MPLAKIAKFLSVGILWGCSNPFIKRGSMRKDSRKEATIFETIWFVLRNPSILIPFLVNQSGSLMFYYLLATEGLTTSVLICNSLTFGFTGLTAWLLGERVNSLALLTLGTALVILGTAICMSSK